MVAPDQGFQHTSRPGWLRFDTRPTSPARRTFDDAGFSLSIRRAGPTQQLKMSTTLGQFGRRLGMERNF